MIWKLRVYVELAMGVPMAKHRIASTICMAMYNQRRHAYELMLYSLYADVEIKV